MAQREPRPATVEVLPASDAPGRHGPHGRSGLGRVRTEIRDGYEEAFLRRTGHRCTGKDRSWHFDAGTVPRSCISGVGATWIPAGWMGPAPGTRRHHTLAMSRPGTEGRGVAGQQGAGGRRAGRTPRLQALHSSMGAKRAKNRFPAPGCRQLRLWRTELPPPRRRGAGRSHAWSGAWPGTAICGPHRTVFHRGLVPVPTTNRAVSPAVMAWSRSADAWPLPHGHAQCPPTADRRRLPQALDGLAHPHRSRRCVAVRLGARVGGWVLLAAGRHADPPDLAGGGRLHWAPPRADPIWPTPSFGCPCCHRHGQVLD